MIKKYIKIAKKLKDMILFRIKLYAMNEWFYFLGMNSWTLFPPSFYHTHTKDEIEHIKQETLRELRKLLQEI